MKNAVETIEAIVQLADNAEAVKPLAHKIVNGLKSFGPEISDILDSIGNYLIDRRAADVKRLEQVHGFSRTDAVTMTLDVHGRIARVLETSKK